MPPEFPLHAGPFSGPQMPGKKTMSFERIHSNAVGTATSKQDPGGERKIPWGLGGLGREATSSQSQAGLSKPWTFSCVRASLLTPPEVLGTCFSKGLAGIYMKDMCPGQRGSSGGAWASKQSSEAGACSPEHGSWLIL